MRTRTTIVVVCGLFAALLPGQAAATPPQYSSFNREQRIDHTPAAQDLLRIWVVYVEQGDGIIIQLPPRYNYDPDPADSDSTPSERMDVIVDGGCMPSSQSWRLPEFITALYPGETPTIEYGVISHHDSDHVRGLETLLEEYDIGLEAVFHNGLASYVAGAQFANAPNFPTTTRPQNAVYKFSNGRLTRGMAFVAADGIHLRPEYLIDDLSELTAQFNAGQLQGVYNGIGGAVVTEADPNPVTTFQRARAGGPFIEEHEANQSRGVNLNGIDFEVLWPLNQLRQYGGRNWGETINGNSVTFRLVYGDFEMLFTGDHNEHSEEAFLEHMQDINEEDKLRCDVLKVPHHGSSHAYEPFFRAVDPVVSVASMGSTGFKSKRLRSSNWQHPSTNVIRWLGGHHRVYHTLIHERRFRWTDLDTQAKHDAMKEYSSILIETDGTWFRVVEIPDTEWDVNNPPSVRDTRRGNGTRWVRAR